jgi:hypothetical protein
MHPPKLEIDARCLRALAIAALTALATLLGAGTANASLTTVPQSEDFLTYVVDAYAGPWGSYTGGVWNSQDTSCWTCNNGGPATAAATAYVLSGDSQPTLLGEAEGTIDTAIANWQRADGAFVGPTGSSPSPDIDTMFFGVEEGNTYLELLPVLDAARKARWQASLAAAADYLIHNGNLNWYTNGNINLGNAELFYLAWRATGDERFDTAYQQAWNFALYPPQSSWPGRGLVIVNQPTRADGSDGSGYLTETGPGGTGFDAEYTSMQLDIACRLYLLSGDPAALRLANLEINMLLPRIDSNFLLDTSGGTRHTQPNRKVSLITSAYAVLGLDGGRSDLAPLALAQLNAIASAYIQPWNYYGAVLRRGLGNDISVIALASNLAQPVGWAAPGAQVSGSPPSPPATAPGPPPATTPGSPPSGPPPPHASKPPRPPARGAPASHRHRRSHRRTRRHRRPRS